MVKLPGFLGGEGHLRQNIPLAIVWVIQLLVAFIVLGTSASYAADFTDAGCNVPAKIGYNVACAVITILALIYLLLSAGPMHIKAVPWNAYVQFGITAVLLVLWIAAIGSSVLDYDDVYGACDGYYKNKKAKRYTYYRSSGYKSDKLAATQAFNSIEMILFLVATIFTGFLVFSGRRGSSNTATAGGMSNQPTGGFGMQQQNNLEAGGQAGQYYNPDNTSYQTSAGGAPVHDPNAAYSYPPPAAKV